MRRFFLLAMALVLLVGCSSSESGTVNAQVQQMKPSARGEKR